MNVERRTLNRFTRFTRKVSDVLRGLCTSSERSERARDRGFTLVEVLIATLIMVMSIVTVTAAIRQFTLNREKLVQYERLYSTVLSLRDRIMNDTLKENAKESGTLNGLPYSYECRLLESANNYLYISEDNVQSGNKGIFTVGLFKVTLAVEGKEFEFYKAQYKKRSGAPQSEF